MCFLLQLIVQIPLASKLRLKADRVRTGTSHDDLAQSSPLVCSKEAHGTIKGWKDHPELTSVVPDQIRSSHDPLEGTLGPSFPRIRDL